MEDKREEYLYFDGESVFSNSWRGAKFNVDGAEFTSVDQGFQYFKALEFGDSRTASLILGEYNPTKARELGRSVQKFTKKDWDERKKHLMFKCMYAKFSQSPLLRELILGTGNQLFVNYGDDLVWSCGLQVDSPGLYNSRRWPGKNLNGKVLFDVREMIKFAVFLSLGLVN